ncbi:YjcQ family protein [Lacticaseibacillus saniviri]
MANNDYFMVAFKILTYLKHCYENGENPNPDMLKPTMYNISANQLIQTFEMLLEDGYIANLGITGTTSGKVLSNLNNTRITSSGLQYLAENSMMQKAYRTAKELRDWLPFI